MHCGPHKFGARSGTNVASLSHPVLGLAPEQVVYAKRLLPTWPYETSHVLDSEMVGGYALSLSVSL